MKRAKDFPAAVKGMFLTMKKIISLVTAGLMLLPNIAQASDLSQWAEPDYEAASQAGLISADLVAKNLQENITRQEFCQLIMKIYDHIARNAVPDADLASSFLDTADANVVRAYNRGIIAGRSAEIFDPEGPITRQEMSKMLINTLKAAEVNVVVLKSEVDTLLSDFGDIVDASDWASIELAIALKYGIVQGVDDSAVEPLGYVTREQAISLIQRTYTQFAQDKVSYTLPEFLTLYDGFTAAEDVELEWTSIDGAKKYTVLVKDSTYREAMHLETKKTQAVIPVSDLQNGSVYYVTIGTELEDGTEIFSTPVEFKYQDPAQSILPAMSAKTTASQTPAELAAKEQRVFPGGQAFTSQAEAAAHMKTVEVPVWVLRSNGTKTASKRSLTVNENLADDVVKIFTEIFNDPSQFPIKNAGGFSWRNTAFGSVSQHSYGTCIDINYEENYYSTASGTPITGKYWRPGEDPYSIPEDSIVVRTFAKYGWLWGGNAWGPNGNRDYMHFTYLGK